VKWTREGDSARKAEEFGTRGSDVPTEYELSPGGEANVTENLHLGTAKWLATPSDGRIIAETPQKTQYDAMNERPIGISRLERKIMTKSTLCSLVAALLALACVRICAAGQITGGVSFIGNVTSYAGTNGTGAVITDFTQAHSLVFGSTTVGDNANGSFAGTAHDEAIFYSPLLINPPMLPNPTNSPLWAIFGTSFTFTLSSLSEPVVSPHYLVLQGTGTLADGNPADSSPAAFVAVFVSAGNTFGWSAVTYTSPGPQLQLAIEKAGNQAVLSWPTNTSGWSLQSTTNFAVPAAWLPVTNLPVVVSNKLIVTNSMTNPIQVFRLIP
jgi:hypothetical protein